MESLVKKSDFYNQPKKLGEDRQIFGGEIGTKLAGVGKKESGAKTGAGLAIGKASDP
jgi:hypothetical protein